MVRLRKSVPVGAALLGALLFLGSPPPASADFTLVIQEYTASGQQVSSQTFNGDTASGILSRGVNTGNFYVSVNAFENAFVSGANPNLHTDVFSISLQNATTDYLRVFLTNTGYTQPVSAGVGETLVNTLSSITAGPSGVPTPTVTMISAADLANTAFGVPTGTTIPPVGSTSSPPLNYTTTSVATSQVTGSAGSATTSTASLVAGSGPISLTNVITVSGMNTAYESISFNAQTTVTPAPGALMLLVSGVPFLAVGGWLRHRGRKNAAGRR